jgi:hypothetical protein
MPKNEGTGKIPFHPEAALFCAAWVAVAIAGYVLEGFVAGALLTFGLMLVLMPTSAYFIAQRDDFVMERVVRWSILIGAGALLALVHALGR